MSDPSHALVSAEVPLRVDDDLDDIVVPVPLVLTLHEAADLMHLHHETARRLAASGEFPVPVFKVGRRWFLRRAHLEELIGRS